MHGGIDVGKVAAQHGERLDWRFKAVPVSAWGDTIDDFLARRPPLAEFGTPLLTLDAGALHHNLTTMAEWTARAGVRLAPHGKTTMAPELWRRQLAAGAWGITLANLPQLRVARAFGVSRLLMAGCPLDPAGLAWLAAELDRDPDLEFVCWADSVAAVGLMDQALRAAGAGRPIDVCVEVGVPGGRTGARDAESARAVAEAIRAAATLRLVGVGGYEGAVAHDATPEGLAAVRGYLERIAALHAELPYETAEPMVTAGGSAYFDLVVEVLGGLGSVHGQSGSVHGQSGSVHGQSGSALVLRSGSYIVHDDGFYRQISPFARGMAPAASGAEPAAPGAGSAVRAGSVRLRSAMHAWARVVSSPEPGLALLDAGKRDLSFDEGLPEPQLVHGRGPVDGARIAALNDQHAFLVGGDVAEGEVVRLGLSHPCTALDKWTLIPVVDDVDAARPTVVDLVRTWF